MFQLQEVEKKKEDAAKAYLEAQWLQKPTKLKRVFLIIGGCRDAGILEHRFFSTESSCKVSSKFSPFFRPPETRLDIFHAVPDPKFDEGGMSFGPNLLHMTFS